VICAEEVVRLAAVLGITITLADCPYKYKNGQERCHLGAFLLPGAGQRPAASGSHPPRSVGVKGYLRRAQPSTAFISESISTRRPAGHMRPFPSNSTTVCTSPGPFIAVIGLICCKELGHRLLDAVHRHTIAQIVRTIGAFCAKLTPKDMEILTFPPKGRPKPPAF